MGKLAVIFPGQGAQHVGMGKDVAAVSAATRRTFEEADRILGFGLSAICFDGPAEKLDATDVSQPAIFVMSVAMWRALEEAGLSRELRTDATAGLSLGEYTALWLAGSLTFEEGLRLVRQRGQFMQAAANAAASGMVSIMGLSESQVDALCNEARAGDVLSPANFNCPGQIVISGSAAACDRALQMVESHGGRGVALRVAGAFHSALMQPAADRLRTVLAEARVAEPRIPVVSNVTAGYHRDPNSIRDLLGAQVVQPVRWEASIRRLAADGVDRFVEVGPGRVLAGLNRKIDRSLATTNYSTAEPLTAMKTS